MNVKYRRMVLRGLLILWMIIIFMMSSRNAVSSTEDSHRIGRLIGEMLIPGFREASIADQERFAERIDYPVRKTAHAAEYAVLGALMAANTTCVIRKRPSEKDIILPWIYTVLYAVSDELHQAIVPGRACQIRDMLLDSAGAAVGILIFFYVRKKILERNSISK